MNYLAHGYRYLDRPYVLVGTAVPDLVVIGDRRRRLREHEVPTAHAHLDAVSAELATGLLAHNADDAWFHNTPAFFATTQALGAIIRSAADRTPAPPGSPRLRASVLAHIGMELLLDAELMRRDRGLLRGYTLALHHVDAERVAERVGRWAQRPPLLLAQVMVALRHMSFLSSYSDDAGFVLRLGQVARRARLGVLPEALLDEVPAMRAVVREQADALLTPPSP